jgi:hypothetical protein
MGKTRPKPGGKSGPKKSAAKGGESAGGPKAPAPGVTPPMTDEQVGPIPGLPAEAEIEQQVGDLSPADRRRFTQIRTLLAERLGSYAAARVWLLTPGRGFAGTPLDAVREGNADLVLDLLKEQSGPNPPYA